MARKKKRKAAKKHKKKTAKKAPSKAQKPRKARKKAKTPKKARKARKTKHRAPKPPPINQVTAPKKPRKRKAKGSVWPIAVGMGMAVIGAIGTGVVVATQTTPETGTN